MESSTMEELFKSFEDKIRNACSKLALLYYYETEHPQMIHVTKIIASIQGMLYQIRESILLQDQDLDIQMKRIADLERLVSDHIDHIEKHDDNLHLNLKGKVENPKPAPSSKAAAGADNRGGYTKTPTRANARTPKTKPPKSTANQTVKTPTITNNAKEDNANYNNNRQAIQKKAPNQAKPTKPLENKQNNNSNDNNNKHELEEKPFPVIEPVSQAEYNQIPSYMIGRISLDTINQFVDSFNLTINRKYKFLADYKSYTSSEPDHKKYQTYKALEFADTRNQHFCTTNDLKEFVAIKNVSTMPKILICLRHCKRIKEIRGGQDAKVVRYAIASN